MRFLLTAVVLMATTTFLRAQSTTSVTVTADADAHTASGSPSTNYGTADSIPIWVQTTSNYKRGYLHFTLPSVPAGTIIASAKLQLTLYGGASGEGTVTTGSFIAALSNTSWTETGIKASGNTADNINVANQTASAYISGSTPKREFDVTDHVQAMIEGRIPNNGWTIRRSSETAASTKAKYYSREFGTATSRPQLIITYYTPASVTAATIVHANTLSATNASITPTISNGSSATRSYAWYNSAGTLISSSQNLTGVGYGWYGLKSIATGTGSAGNDVVFQAFMVGVQCEEVSIGFTPSADYFDDAMIWNSQSGSDLGQVNYGDFGYEVAANKQSSAWYNQKTLMKFNLWMDNALTVTQADLTMTGFKHETTGRTNTSRLTQVTSAWREKGVAYNTQPSSSTSINVPITGTTGQFDNRTLDLRTFWNTWKASNTTNYGMLFELASYTNVATLMQFYSSDASSSQPTIAFKVAIPNCDLSTQGRTSIVANADDGVNVTVDITPPSWAVSPYSYFISENPIAELSDWYHYLRDSVYGTLDSTRFFTQGSTALTRTFENQSDGTYYLAVFDAAGKRIYNNSTLYQFPVNLVGASNISITGQKFSTGASAGYASFDRYLNAFQGGMLSITPASASSVQYYGITETGRTISSGADVRNGVRISANQVTLISNYSPVGSASAYTAGTPINISVNGRYITYYIGNTATYLDSLVDSLDYKPAMYMAANTNATVISKSLSRVPVFVHYLSIPGYSNLSHERNCSNTDLPFRFKVTNLGAGDTYSYSIVPNSQISGMVGPIDGSSNPASPITGSGTLPMLPVTLNALPPGIYQISVTITVNATHSSTTRTFVLPVGIQASWLESANYNIPSSAQNSVSAQSILTGRSITKNLIPPTDQNAQWFWFNPVFGTTMPFTVIHSVFQNFRGYKLFAALSSTYPSAVLGNADSYFSFLKQNSSIVPAFHPANSSMITLSAESYTDRRYFMMVQNAQLRLYSEYQGHFTLLFPQPGASAIPAPAGNLRLETNTALMPGGGFKKVFSTHCIPATTPAQVGHFEAKRDLEAGFTFSYQNKLKFTFDEEYDVPAASKLEYILYDDNHNQLAHYIPGGTSFPSGLQALTYTFDDNRFQLDLSPINNITVNKFYFVEIITSKGDRRFVKFQSKANTSATIQPQNPDEQSN